MSYNFGDVSSVVTSVISHVYLYFTCKTESTSKLLREVVWFDAHPDQNQCAFSVNRPLGVCEVQKYRSTLLVEMKQRERYYVLIMYIHVMSYIKGTQ